MLKRLKWKGIAGIVISLGAAILFMCTKGDAVAIQNQIADKVIRLHVVANSNTDEDQKLKLKVRDAIVSRLRKNLALAKDRNEAEEIIKSNLDEIEKIAQKVMYREGFCYTAKAALEDTVFPVKKYGDLTFPAGEYEALRIQIGKAGGKNWWCVMYPTLCFIDSTYQIVPEESKEVLKNELSQEEYKMLLQGGEEVSYGFKLLDWLEKLVG